MWLPSVSSSSRSCATRLPSRSFDGTAWSRPTGTRWGPLSLASPPAFSPRWLTEQFAQKFRLTLCALVELAELQTGTSPEFTADRLVIGQAPDQRRRLLDELVLFGD